MLLRVELARSRLLDAGVAISYVLALASLLYAELPPWSSCAIAFGVFTSALLRERSSERPVALLISDEIIRLYFPGHQINVVLETECYCTPWLQILHFREFLREPTVKSQPLTSPALDSPAVSKPRPRFGTSRYCVILLPDSCSKSVRRRLVVLLRWRRFARSSQLA